MTVHTVAQWASRKTNRRRIPFGGAGVHKWRNPFFEIFDPPLPLPLILLKRLMEWRHLLADTPSLLSGWHHLWMDPFRIDDPICWSIYMEKMNLLKTYIGTLWGSVNYRFCILKLKPWAKCVSVYRFKYLQYNARTLEVHIGVDY